MNANLLFEFLKKNGLNGFSAILLFLWFSQSQELKEVKLVLFECYEERIRSAEFNNKRTALNIDSKLILPNQLVCILPTEQKVPKNLKDGKEKSTC